MNKQKKYVLDTSVYLTNCHCLSAFSDADIVIPLKVLDEIDKHKKRQDTVGTQARGLIRMLDAFRAEGNLAEGVKMPVCEGVSSPGTLSVKSYNPLILPDDLDLEDSDNQIIATALSEKEAHPECEIVVVSKDINMRVKCDSLGLLTEDYNAEQVLEQADGLFSGMASAQVDDNIIDRLHDRESIRATDLNLAEQIYPNQFLLLISDQNEKKTVLVRNTEDNILSKVEAKKDRVWGLKPRNKEQMFALNLLLDPNVPVVTLVGKAGCGKTLLALAAGLEQTLNPESAYKKVVVTKPVEPVGKEIGFLPGTLEEKMLPWLAPIQDNLQFLMGNDKTTLDLYVEDGKIEIEAMTYIRGRSISNAFIIIDEAQNMTQHEIKTVLTRVGEGTKIVLTGDIEQIDNVYIDATNNGLSYIVEKFKNQEVSGHITLMKGERSKVASIASAIL